MFHSRMRWPTLFRTLVATLTICFLSIALEGCNRPQDRIVGKWKMQNDATVWEFSKNGAVTNGNISGKYSFGDRGRMKIQTAAATFVYEVEFNDDGMAWKDPNGSRMELKRVP